MVRNLAVIAFVQIGLCAAGCISAAPGYRGPKTDHFDGEQFENLAPFKDKGFFDVLGAFAFEPGGDWNERETLSSNPSDRVHPGLHVTFINHSTVLVQIDGFNVLTDPIYSERASPFSWAGPSRYHAPGIAFDDLPPIDAVVLSHNHYDHFDVPTLRRLASRDGPTLIGGLGSKALLAEEDVPGGEDLDWWETTRVGPLKIHAVPAQHWSRRGIGDTRNTLWAGYVIEGPSAAVYFAGDTAWGPHFDQVRERFASIDVALLPVGAYKPRDFMRSSHISPWEAVDAAVVLGAKVSIPIHWGTFDLGLDGPTEGLEAVASYLSIIESPPLFEVLQPGQSYILN